MKKMMKTWILNPHLKVEGKNHNGPTTGGIELQLRAAIPLTEAGAGGGHPWMTWTMSLPLNVKIMIEMVKTSSFHHQTPIPLHLPLVGIPVEPPAQVRDGSGVEKIPYPQPRRAKPVLARGKEGGTRRVQTLEKNLRVMTLNLGVCWHFHNSYPPLGMSMAPFNMFRLENKGTVGSVLK